MSGGGVVGAFQRDVSPPSFWGIRCPHPGLDCFRGKRVLVVFGSTQMKKIYGEGLDSGKSSSLMGGITDEMPEDAMMHMICVDGRTSC